MFDEIQDERTAKYWRQLFNNVAKGWNQGRRFIDKEVYQTTLLELNENVIISIVVMLICKTPIINCLRSHADEGKQIQALLSFMATKQNYFIQQAMGFIDKEMKLVDLDIDQVHSSYMVDCSLEENSDLSMVIRHAAEISLDYGKGTEVSFNFSYIQVQELLIKIV